MNSVAVTGASPSLPAQSRWWQFYRRIVIVICLAIVGVNLWGMAVYLQESRRLRNLADQVTAGATSKSEEVHRLVDYLATEVPRGRPNVSFLLSVFSPLRPTAWQVVQHGGDCSYKARAFIVLAGHRGIPAKRWALYQSDGVSTHAVAVAQTEQGDYVCDLLFGIVYEDAKGLPVSLRELQSDPELHARLIDKEVQKGNPFAAKYPLDKYSFQSPRSIHWEHNPLLHFVYKALAACFGRDWADNLSVPHFLNEPAQVVALGSLLCVAFLWLPLGIGNRRSRRSSLEVAADSSSSPANHSAPLA